jgi:hypothetical protein
MTRAHATTGALAALLILAAAGPVRADRPDCVAVHDTIQAELEAACPCDGFPSHGKYVQCVTRKLRAMAACETGPDGEKTCGPVPRTCVGKIRRVASRSACGRAGAVTCCIPKQHDCTGDPAPGDGRKEGTCSSGRKRCDKVEDCVAARCQLTTSAEHCTLAGGRLGNGKNCRTACQ